MNVAQTPLSRVAEVNIDARPEIRVNLSNVEIDPSAKKLCYNIEGVERRFPVWADLFPLTYRGDTYHGTVFIDANEQILRLSRGEQCFESKPEDCIEINVTEVDIEHSDALICYYVGKLARKS